MVALILFVSIVLKLKIDAFLPWNIAQIVYLMRHGYVDSSLTSAPGYFIVGVFILNVSGISPELLVNVPLLFIPMLVLSFGIVKDAIPFIDTNKNLTYFLWYLMLVLIFYNFSEPIYFWRHSVGYIILLSIVLILLKGRFTYKDIILLLILNIPLSLLSYKISFLLFIMLLILTLYCYYSLSDISRKLEKVLILYVVVILSENKFFYNDALPIVISSVRDFGYFSLAMWLKSLSSHSLKLCNAGGICLDLYTTRSAFLAKAHAMLYILVIISIIIGFLYILKHYNALYLSYPLGTIVSLLLSGCVIMGVYSILGVVHTRFFYLGLFLLYGYLINILYLVAQKHIKTLVQVFMVLFILLGLIIVGVSVYENITSEKFVPYNTPGTYVVSKWVSLKIPQENTVSLDVYTRGYTMVYLNQQHMCTSYLCNTKWITKEDLFAIISPNQKPQFKFLVLNFEIPYIELDKWIKVSPSKSLELGFENSFLISTIYSGLKCYVVINE